MCVYVFVCVCCVYVTSNIYVQEEYGRPSLNPLCFLEKFLLLVCELFRAHEMRSQLEVTEMFEPSFQRNTLLHRSCGLYAWKWGLESVKLW